MNENNPCRCAKKIQSAVKAGLVDPEDLRFNLPYLHRIRELAAEKASLVDSAMELKLQSVLRDQPMYSSPDFKRLIRIILRRREIGEIVDFR